jgi:dTDP-glucose 4,6-dehydratase
MDEAHPLQAQSPYSASKIAADKLAESFVRSFEASVVTVRPFNTYGPRQSARAVIPTIITQALEGGDIRLGNLTPTRDLTFVGDMARGFLALGSADGVVGETVNLGTGSEFSVGSIARLVCEILGRPEAIQQESQRMRAAASEVERLCADTTKVRQLTDWKPQTSLREGLALTIDWIKSNRGRYRTREYVK